MRLQKARKEGASGAGLSSSNVRCSQLRLLNKKNPSPYSLFEGDARLRFISGVRATYQIYSVDIASKTIKPVTKGKHTYNSISLAGEEIVTVGAI